LLLRHVIYFTTLCASIYFLFFLLPRFIERILKIAITDNGSGIPESIQKQIFNPFFTTKPIGKGTGMGMAISYQIIIEKHGGKLDFFSTPGKGTEFVVQIPIQQQVYQVI
ncbi:MAG: ATP-binding protein, partial [Nostoc sp.]|uniref:sensor histidine kinase n=1 Tax=Nostoc sp. TaxID=1180 RepID=UPI002FF593C4